MEAIDSIDWNVVWGVIKDLVIPYSGILIFNTVIFLTIGLLLSILFIVLMSRKGVFRRTPKYYNWAVKLYIPMLIIVFLYFFGQIGFARGIFKIFEKEEENIVSGIYYELLNDSFESEESKKAFIVKLRQTTKSWEGRSDKFVEAILTSGEEIETGSSLIDTGSNKLSNFLMNNYGAQLSKVILYHVVNLTGKQVHIEVSDAVSYNDFNQALDYLQTANHQELELAFKDRLNIWFDAFLIAQYYSFVKVLLITLLCMILIPVFEFIIYKKFIEKKFVRD